MVTKLVNGSTYGFPTKKPRKFVIELSVSDISMIVLATSRWNRNIKVNHKETKYIFLYRHQLTHQNLQCGI